VAEGGEVVAADEPMTERWLPSAGAEISDHGRMVEDGGRVGLAPEPQRKVRISDDLGSEQLHGHRIDGRRHAGRNLGLVPERGKHDHRAVVDAGHRAVHRTLQARCHRFHGRRETRRQRDGELPGHAAR
jgi:hypothetical protein